MAVLIKPSNIVRGQKNYFSLVMSDLLSMISDDYFKDPTVWSCITLSYKSTVGNQVKVIAFNPSTLQGSLTLSAKSRNSFIATKIAITDLDGGSYIINRSQLPAADMDITL